MSDRQATIKDVALACGVSPSTVSRALSGKIPVSQKTMEQIKQAAERLNYIPSILAQSLKEGSSRTIGLIVPDITNPVFPAVVLGAETEAVRQGYQLFLAHSHENPEQEKQLAQMLIQRQTDGLLIATSCRGQASPADWLPESVPVCQLVRRQTDRLPSVTVDQFMLGRLAAQHLLETGRKKPLILVGDQTLAIHRDRLEGFRQTLKQANVELPQERIVDSSMNDENGVRITFNLLRTFQSTIDSIFAASDIQALSAIRALGLRQIPVPRQIAVIGLDNLGISALCTPTMTCISQPLQEVGRLACQRLIEILSCARTRRDQEKTGMAGTARAEVNQPAIRHDLLPCELYIGETT